MKINKALLFELNISREPNTNLVLLRAILDPEFTRLDFGYIATNYYVKGGWIRISPATYIRHKETDEMYLLTHAENIPFSPQHFHFESTKDWQYFSLFFPPLPQDSMTIDIIEAEQPDSTDFNYYDISLDIRDGQEIIRSLD